MIIKLSNLITGYYGYNLSPSVSGHIAAGNLIAIIGPNGIGKSTLLKTLAGLLPPISGSLEFRKRRKLSIGYLPQKKNVDYNIPLTVFDVVSMGCWPATNFLKELTISQKFLIWRALKTMSLLNLLNQCIDSLSGGQFQRMLFARILVQRASLILLDEPFHGIDSATCKIMLRSINKLCQRGCAALVALHDDNLICEYFSKILLLTPVCSVWKSSE